MLEQKRVRLLAKLHEIDKRLKKQSPRIEVAERRVGRWLGRYSAAERLFHVEVIQDESKAIGLEITKKDVPATWADLSHGTYLLRTNCTEQDPTKLWQWYISTHAGRRRLSYLEKRSEPASRLPSGD